MQITLVLATLSAAFVAAAPSEFDSRQADVVRVQFSNDAQDIAIQTNIPANRSRVRLIDTAFRGLGNPLIANRALVVGSTVAGTCNIFKDAAGRDFVATIAAGANDANFGTTDLTNGVIVCK